MCCGARTEEELVEALKKVNALVCAGGVDAETARPLREHLMKELSRKREEGVEDDSF